MRSFPFTLRQGFRWVSAGARAAFALVCGCAFASRSHEYNVTGEFRPDGTCTAVVDGEPLFGPNDDPRTWVDDGQIVCGPLARSGVPNTEKFNHVRAMLFKPHREPLRPGRYQIDAENPRPERRWHGHVTVWDLSLNANPTGLKGQLGKYYIDALQGEFELSAIDSTRAVGRFAVRTRKKWSR